MVDVKVTNVKPNIDDMIETDLHMVTRMEVDSLDNHFIMVKIHYWESPEAEARNEQKMMKFAIRDDGAKALARSLEESVEFNILQDKINQANKRTH